jgi:hypothetical protein
MIGAGRLIFHRSEPSLLGPLEVVVVSPAAIMAENLIGR